MKIEENITHSKYSAIPVKTGLKFPTNFQYSD